MFPYCSRDQPAENGGVAGWRNNTGHFWSVRAFFPGDAGDKNVLPDCTAALAYRGEVSRWLRPEAPPCGTCGCRRARRGQGNCRKVQSGLFAQRLKNGNFERLTDPTRYSLCSLLEALQDFQTVPYLFWVCRCEVVSGARGGRNRDDCDGVFEGSSGRGEDVGMDSLVVRPGVRDFLFEGRRWRRSGTGGCSGDLPLYIFSSMVRCAVAEWAE